MNFANPIGQTIDGKYKIERQLGKGGMGTVYLATHLGTERPVAVKVIAPQFMERLEFVERFRREARAAGRLRHPNVVDVTDFGIAESESGKTAYLVMEYLDGCTLGEILDEEKKLPLDWSLDILEQVCSAVHAAHEQGIIHRDLKPDNIWLEPNGRGGYTVKVLDFGIAKLEESPHSNHHSDGENSADGLQINPLQLTDALHAATTVSDKTQPNTVVESSAENSTLLSEKGTAILAAEAGTLIQPTDAFSEQGTAILNSGDVDLESGTAILPGKGTQIIQKEDGTRLMTDAADTDKSLEVSTTAELTRVGAVLGTPLYMSPEQCRGEKLSPRSDIYSLGVITYQMLGGKTPFEGDYRDVMESHKNIAPPPLEAKKVPYRLKKMLHSTLAKDANERPPTAEAFASILRSYSEGVWTLMSRAMVIYSENAVKFVLLAFIVYLPMEVLFVLNTTVALLEESGAVGELTILRTVTAISFSLSGFFCGTILAGVVTWLVAQKMAVPMRPLALRPAFAAVRKRLKSLFGTAVFSSIISFLGFMCLLVPGLIMWVCWALVTPVVMMEGLKGRRAFARSFQLVKRNIWTTLGIMLLTLVSIAVITLFSTLLSKGILGDMIKSSPPAAASSSQSKERENVQINLGKNGGMKVNPVFDENETEEQKRERRLKGTIRETAYAAIQIPLSVLVGLFFAIVLALLYVKSRLAGGESIADLLSQFEESDQPRSHWQRRIRDRLIESGRVTTGKTEKRSAD